MKTKKQFYGALAVFIVVIIIIGYHSKAGATVILAMGVFLCAYGIYTYKQIAKRIHELEPEVVACAEKTEQFYYEVIDKVQTTIKQTAELNQTAKWHQKGELSCSQIEKLQLLTLDMLIGCYNKDVQQQPSEQLQLFKELQKILPQCDLNTYTIFLGIKSCNLNQPEQASYPERYKPLKTELFDLLKTYNCLIASCNRHWLAGAFSYKAASDMVQHDDLLTGETHTRQCAINSMFQLILPSKKHLYYMALVLID